MGEKIKALMNKENRKKLLNLMYSILAAGIFNLVIQIIVYPDFNRVLGDSANGVALAIISMLAITAGTCGYAVNCSRILGVEKGYTKSSDYNIILLGMGIICSVIGVVYIYFRGYTSPLSLVLYILLMFATMLRYYSEVEFKINTNFFRYMIYYILISVGYVAGLFIFRKTGQWMVPLIIGESLAVLFVVIFGKIYRPPFIKPTKAFLPIFSSIGLIFLSALIDNVTLHADRILLLSITGNGTFVSIYYAASLMGKVVSMLTLPINAILISYLVRYNGGLTKKLWLAIIAGASAFGILGFAGCAVLSPFVIKILYTDLLAAARPFLIPAILGQVFYFVSGMLMMVLLRFKGEKKQLIFNAAYAVIFFSSVAVGTVIGGLTGFVYGILIANAVRFAAAVVWGFMKNSKCKVQNAEIEEAAESKESKN
ncbi:MAG: hypothetical protein E7607_07270 [Ruminococcaceae bacterium]|nr:hypothetical protein [Oscillospiraceae bacterium]